MLVAMENCWWDNPRICQKSAELLYSGEHIITNYIYNVYHNKYVKILNIENNKII